MPRRLLSTDAILDATRDLVAAGGRRAATLEAVAAASEATTGSIYHRFASIDALVAVTWLRARSRSEEAWLGTARVGDPREAVVATALAVYDFCLRERAEARMLGAISAADLLARPLPDDVASALHEADARTQSVIAELARGCWGRADRTARDKVLLATIDLPFGAAGRYLSLTGASPPAARRRALESAARGVLQA